MAKYPSIAPTHPGEILREDILPALNITRVAFAEAIGVSRNTLQRLLSQRSAVTPEMALRLGNGPSFWVRLQSAYDFHHAQETVDVSGISMIEAA